MCTMIKNDWSILCKSTSIDKDTNSISLFNVIEEVNIVGPPLPNDLKKDEDVLLPLSFEIVSLWSRVDKDKPIQSQAIIVTKTPYGKEYKGKPIPIDLSGFLRTRTRIKHSGIPFKKSGVYNFSIRIKKGETKQFIEVSNIQLYLTFKIDDNSTKVKINQ